MKLEITLSCKASIKKHCRKNSLLEKAIRKKLNQILENPYHFKPLKYSLANERRVHIMKSFVLRYSVNHDTATLIDFSHHDESYRR